MRSSSLLRALLCSLPFCCRRRCTPPDFGPRPAAAFDRYVKLTEQRLDGEIASGRNFPLD